VGEKNEEERKIRRGKVEKRWKKSRGREKKLEQERAKSIKISIELKKKIR
jgi:hypothetical protein